MIKAVRKITAKVPLNLKTIKIKVKPREVRLQRRQLREGKPSQYLRD